MLEIDDLSMSISHMSENISSSKKEERIFIKQTIDKLSSHLEQFNISRKLSILLSTLWDIITCTLNKKKTIIQSKSVNRFNFLYKKIFNITIQYQYIKIVIWQAVQVYIILHFATLEQICTVLASHDQWVIAQILSVCWAMASLFCDISSSPWQRAGTSPDSGLVFNNSNINVK